MTAVPEVDSVLVLRVLEHTVDHSRHRRVKVDLFNPAVCTSLAGDSPAVRVDYPQPLDREAVDHSKEYPNPAPVTVLALAFLSGVGAERVAVLVPEAPVLSGLPCLFRYPVGVFLQVFHGFRAGVRENLRAVAGSAEMIRALEDTETLSADVYVREELVVVEPEAAVRAAEEVVARGVRELDFRVPHNHGRV